MSAKYLNRKNKMVEEVVIRWLHLPVHGKAVQNAAQVTYKILINKYGCILHLNHYVPRNSIYTFVHFGLNTGVAPGSFPRSTLLMLSPTYSIHYKSVSGSSTRREQCQRSERSPSKVRRPSFCFRMLKIASCTSETLNRSSLNTAPPRPKTQYHVTDPHLMY
ncbi:hypothetical protein BGX30_013188 [Mortierella sp. GBA39]|nr:hypothetical protein BGX30_013188 [Mortierella sp. GBA39]